MAWLTSGDQPSGDSKRLASGDVVLRMEVYHRAHTERQSPVRRLRHERDEHAVLLGDFLEQDSEEDEAVCHGKRIGVAEVEFELAVGPPRTPRRAGPSRVHRRVCRSVHPETPIELMEYSTS